MNKTKYLFLLLFLNSFFSKASDIIEIVPITNKIIALHFDDGYTVYHKKGELRSNEYVVAEPLNFGQAKINSNYSLISLTDPNYINAQYPLDIGRKSKGTEFTWLCQNWNNGCNNNEADHVEEHWIYLYLPEPLQNNHTYILNTKEIADNGHEWKLNYDETTIYSSTIHTNLIGYKPTATAKYAYLYNWLGENGSLDLSTYVGKRFYLVNHFSNEMVYEGIVEFRKSKNNVETGQTGETPNANFLGSDVYECDFSNFSQSGKYRLVVEGLGCSSPFRIDEKIYQQIFYTSIRGLYHNRSGIELKEPYTDFVRPAPHNPLVTPGFSGKLKYSSSRFIDWSNGDHSSADKAAIEARIKGSIDSWGWYQDAGDWDGYYTHLNVPTILLLSWQIAPDNYPDYQLNLPESGNGIPDILDEAAWLPRFFYRIRHELIAKGFGTGGVGGRVCGDHFGNDGEGVPSYEDTTRIFVVSGEDPHTTYKYAALAAQLAYCLEKIGVADPEHVDWEKEAIESYQWAKNNTRVGDENTKPAMPDKLKDFRAFAAAGLLQLTGEQQYKTQLEADLSGLSPSGTLSGEKRWAPFVVANFENTVQVNATLKNNCKLALLNTADAMVQSAQRRACRWGGDFYFPMLVGQSTTPMIFEIIMAYHLIKEKNSGKAEDYLSVVHTTADYFLGTNPLNTTWITGLGIKRPERVFHLDSWYNGKDEIVPGITPYGPWRDENYFTGQGPWDVAWSYRSIYPSNIDEWPGHERWFGNSTCPLNAEFTIHQNTILNAAVYGFLAGSANNDFIPNKKPEISDFEVKRIAEDTLLVKATVSDPDGNNTIHKVEFYYGWHKIGEDKTFPYECIFVPVKGGQFQLKAKVIDELGAFSVSEVNEENTTGVLNSVEKQSNTNFYPNPFNDCITFSLNENISGKVRLEIFTINGDLIWNTEITKLIHVPKIVSWTPDRRVTSGIYFSRITYEKNKKILSELGKIIYQN